MVERRRWNNRDVYYVTESPLGYAVSGGPLDLMALPVDMLTDEEYAFVLRVIEAGREAVEVASR